MRVMIVDDHGLFRSGLVSLFNSQPDFKVVDEAGTLKEAISTAEATHPDLIIMDLGLPDGTGIEAMSRILQKNPHVMVVFLTIHASDERAFAALRLGAKGFLLKDIAAPKLLAALRGLQRGELALPRDVQSRFVEEILHFIKPQSTQEASAQMTLTPRQLEVLAELTSGDSNREIAERLSISENTLKVHVHNILGKLDLNSRQEAADYARRHGFVKAESGSWLNEIP